MKQFLVLLAVLPMMLVFLLQFILLQQLNMKIDLMTDIVYEAKETAKQQGGFDTDALRNKLSEKLGVDAGDILIEAPGLYTVKRVKGDGSRGIIEYKVTVPMGKVNAGVKYFGLDESARYGYCIDSCCPSEYLGE